jgi:UDP-N-acetylglucosamine--N-acetylmuramyl-(pentapeptide) pyrophosphoryl-undecaprenol N-acetylglucosamine transferase
VTGAVVLAAGGTGGHLFPAEALARALVDRGTSVHLITDRRADAFAAAVPGVAVIQVRAGRLGGDPLRTAYGLAEMALGIMQARRHLRRLAPDVVVGFGGYPSVPTMLAAAQLGYPTVIHEQNAVLGRANRFLSSRAKVIATGFPQTSGVRPGDRARVVATGNPVRPAIRDGAAPYAPLEPGQPIELLVTGGSQGAHVFAEIVPAALAMLQPETREWLRVSK